MEMDRTYLEVDKCQCKKESTKLEPTGHKKEREVTRNMKKGQRI